MTIAPLHTHGLVRALQMHIRASAAPVQLLAGRQRRQFWPFRSKSDDEKAVSGTNGQSEGANGDSQDSRPDKGGGSSGSGEGDGGSHGRKKGGAEAGGAAQDTMAVVPVNKELRREGGAPSESNLIALPLVRRPLFPGQQQLIQVTHKDVIKELMNLLEVKRPPIIGAFLHKQEAETAAALLGEAEGNESKTHLEDLAGSDPLEVLYKVGTRARITQAAPFLHQGKHGLVEGMQLLIHGQDLIQLEQVLDIGPPVRVQVSKVKYSTSDDHDQLKAYINEVLHTIREIMKINPQFREHAATLNQGLERMERGDPHAIAHFGASMTTASGAELMEVIMAGLPTEKLRLVLLLLKKELELSQLQHKIAAQIEEKVSTHQREILLREQLKMIKKELGEDKNDGTEALVQKFRERLEGKAVPKEAKDAIEQEMEKFSNLVKESQEYQMTRNYLDWLTMLPWGKYSDDTLSLAKARTILDRDHYGLNDVKERILELIAVGVLRGNVQGKILCFVGPPGVGKTSIGRSIAEALGREFYRFSVGGLYDVAEIKGHRRTYVGAMPGKVIQCLKKVQTSNPLVLIDEVDKLGRGHQGDPASALLELLDPSQNSSFLDHYLDVPVDCSRVLFVCTANVTDTIPGPLLDRMEVIRLSGYDLQEKLKIAQDYLVPNTMREVGLWQPLPSKEAPKEAAPAEGQPADGQLAGEAAGDAVNTTTPQATEATPAKPAVPSWVAALGEKAAIDLSAVEALIRWYCREAGVRNLQKHIEKISRKLVIKVVEQHEKKSASEQATEADAAAGPPADLPELRVTEDNLSDFVGKPIFTSERLYEGCLPAGTVTGLAWTALGGSVLYIEASAMPRPGGGKPTTPSLSVTGQLGSVMKESSQIALLVARRYNLLHAPEDRRSFFDEHELYLHCPEGATPKDGPSAGVTMTTALLSLGLGRPTRADLAMTGEVSLNGKVLAVGGIKEKTIAARRAGCKALVFPQGNRRDFDELPDYLREGLEAHFASEYSDVFSIAFPSDSAEADRAAG